MIHGTWLRDDEMQYEIEKAFKDGIMREQERILKIIEEYINYKPNKVYGKSPLKPRYNTKIVIQIIKEHFKELIKKIKEK